MLKVNNFCDFMSKESKLCYIKENLASLAHSPNQLVYSGTTLYFSFEFGQGEYIPVLLNVETKKLTVLRGIKDAFAIAKDPKTEEIYFGGNYGIYKYNPTFKMLKKLFINNLDVWWIQVKKKLYFIKFPSLMLYYYENKTIKTVQATKNSAVNQFVLDSDDNMFFINTTGLYGIKNGDNKVLFLKDKPRFFGIAVDNTGHVYLCSENGIYVINKTEHKVKRILNVQGVLAMTFDANNRLIYSDSHEIVRLTPVSRDEFSNVDNIYYVSL
ncbi:ommochrome-binding protein-like [Bicyclus anynana]|uniref:Ommochrome-binding protein-like n=1 Tax=Bicyclus anynana TaxID=110368 RepID=A0A6J1P4V4_BICAN|nr:ommochrome-binding protein-like [Bicyclus anynana]